MFSWQQVEPPIGLSVNKGELYGLKLIYRHFNKFFHVAVVAAVVVVVVVVEAVHTFAADWLAPEHADRFDRFVVDIVDTPDSFGPVPVTNKNKFCLILIF